MKILSAIQLKELDQCTLGTENTNLAALVENTARACFDWLQSNAFENPVYKLFSGPGNNGADGLALARLLLINGNKVSVYMIRSSEKCSEDFNLQLALLKHIKSEIIQEINTETGLPLIDTNDIIIDALLGTGLSRPMSGLLDKTVKHINESKATVIALDMPSGLYADQKTDPESTVIKANYTLTFESPRLAMLFPENEIYVGKWFVLPIGLSTACLEKLISKNIYLTKDLVRKLLKPRKIFSHKGLFGHALLIAGSKGKMGAAVLAGKACLRTGAGLLTIHVPACGYDIMQISLPEAMVQCDPLPDFFSAIGPSHTDTIIGIGPGIGLDPQTQQALKSIIQTIRRPLVLDADALNILAENKTWLHFIPENSILTPHPKEFERLAGKASDSFQRQQLLKEFALKYKVYTLLKGAHTIIATPEGKCFFNSTGNAGMAKGGSGDVLTGILLGLMAQGYTPIEVCLLGVYLHGSSGDAALKKASLQSLMPSDCIEAISDAYNDLSSSDAK